MLLRKVNEKSKKPKWKGSTTLSRANSTGNVKSGGKNGPPGGKNGAPLTPALSKGAGSFVSEASQAVTAADQLKAERKKALDHYVTFKLIFSDVFHEISPFLQVWNGVSRGVTGCTWVNGV